MSKRATRVALTLVGCGGLLLAFAGRIVPATSGCTTRQCDGSTTNWTTGCWIDANTWQTNDVDQPWIHVGPNAVVNISWYNDAGGPRRDVVNVSPLVGVAADDKDPNDDPDAGDNFTLLGGQNPEYEFWPGADANPHDQHITIFNNTCSPYLERFVITFLPLGDAGASAADTAATKNHCLQQN